MLLKPDTIDTESLDVKQIRKKARLLHETSRELKSRASTQNLYVDLHKLGAKVDVIFFKRGDEICSPLNATNLRILKDIFKHPLVAGTNLVMRFNPNITSLISKLENETHTDLVNEWLKAFSPLLFELGGVRGQALKTMPAWCVFYISRKLHQGEPEIQLVETFLDSIKKRGGNLSAHTQKQYIATLDNICRWEMTATTDNANKQLTQLDIVKLTSVMWVHASQVYLNSLSRGINPDSIMDRNTNKLLDNYKSAVKVISAI